METKTRILLPFRRDAGKRHHRGPHEHGDAGDLGRGGKQRGDRCRRALIDIGRPHMERHCRNLEAEAREKKHEAEDQADAAMRRRLRYADEGHGAGEAVDQRRAVKQHAGRQRAQDEIFQAGFGRAQLVAMACGRNIERQAHQFETEIERDQVGRRNQHQHAERRQQHQHRVLEPFLPFALGVVDRHGDCRGRAEQRQDFEKSGEVVDHETAAEAHKLAFGQQQQDHAGHDQKRDRRKVDDPHREAAAKRADHEQRHGAERQHDFRQERHERRELCSVHRITSSRQPPARPAARDGSCRSIATPIPRRSRAQASDKPRSVW